jgi:putative transposase
MPVHVPHRKTIKHYDEPGNAHELTFSCYRRMPLLMNDRRRRLLSQGIDRAIDRHGFGLIAFVYMPEHVHLLVFPRKPAAEVARLLYAIKRPVSFRIKGDMLAHHDPLLDRLTIRERPGKRSFRFWQEGPGYDRNLGSLKTVKAGIDYIHQNPVRRGLCDSPDRWTWSSWRYYHLDHYHPDPDLPRIHGIPG